MKNFYIFICALLFTAISGAQEGFTSITPLSNISVSSDTGEKPQSKVWQYDGKHWTVLSQGGSTYLWRLDGNFWTRLSQLAAFNSNADVKVVNNVVHILLYTGTEAHLVSRQYDPGNYNYTTWSPRQGTQRIHLDDDAETATLDIDGTGRMWVIFNGDDDDDGEEDYIAPETDNIFYKYSDYPYNFWSSRSTLFSGVDADDIGAVISMPGKIGVLWANSNSQRFGFRTHLDGAPPSQWTQDEIPASQSAHNVGKGFSDDHINMALASDGTLFCAVKTSYDTSGYPVIGLLIRRPSGVWDDFYPVANIGTRPIVLLNESAGKVKVMYTEQNGGCLLYTSPSPRDS